MVSQNYSACLGRLGRPHEALVQLRGALESLLESPSPHVRATVQGNLGTALFDAGRGAEAQPLLDEALVAARHIGDLPSERQYSGLLGELLLRAGDLPSSATLLLRALALSPPEEPAQRVSALHRVALLRRAEGDPLLAEAAEHEAARLTGAAPLTID